MERQMISIFSQPGGARLPTETWAAAAAAMTAAVTAALSRRGQVSSAAVPPLSFRVLARRRVRIVVPGSHRDKSSRGHGLHARAAGPECDFQSGRKFKIFGGAAATFLRAENVVYLYTRTHGNLMYQIHLKKKNK